MPKVRSAEPQRSQGTFEWSLPEDSLPQDHRARVLWRVVETLELSRFTASAKAVEGGVGRRVLSSRMLLTLWLYALSVGVGSAREIARRINSDSAFRWIVGDQKVGHAKLSEFLSSHREALDQLFTDVLGALVFGELISLEVVAQDGTRVRASAGLNSFRRAESLEACREQAALHVKAVLAEIDDREASSREFFARLLAAKDYEKRVLAAIVNVQQLDSERPRASTTDADARIMKMPDGGFRPGYNVQLATVGSAMGGPRTIVGVRVTNSGSDKSSVKPMLDQIEQRTGILPSTLLADGDHATIDCITDATRRGVTPIIAITTKAKRSKEPKSYAYDTEEVSQWRHRMKTNEIRAIYRTRAGLCELTNAHLKERGLRRLLVRGLEKVTCVALLAAISANILAHASSLLAT